MSAAFQRIQQLYAALECLDGGDLEAVAVAGHRILDCAQDSELPDSAGLLLRAAAAELQERGKGGGGAPISDIQRLIEAASAGVAEAERLCSIPPFAHDALELAAHAAQILEKESHTRRWDQRESLIPPDLDELMVYARRVFRIPRDGALPRGLAAEEYKVAGLSSVPASAPPVSEGARREAHCVDRFSLVPAQDGELESAADCFSEQPAAGQAALAEAVAGAEAVEVATTRTEREPEPMPLEERELLVEFGSEAREYLEAAEAALLCLEDDVGNKEAVDTVFRAFHTVKGVASLLGLTVIADFAHAAETLLSRLRSNETAYDFRTANLALRSVDLMGGFIRQACEQFTDRRLALPEDYESLCASLLDDAFEVPSSSSDSEGSSLRPAPLSARSPRGGLSRTEPEVSKQPGEEECTGLAKADAWMRVRTDRLDCLMDIVGELVILQSMVSEDPGLSNPLLSHLRRKIARSDKIVRELQDLTLSLRMVPLQGVFRKMNRVLRDTAQKTKKRATLVIEGAETEIDRNMVDLLSDPLVHMVRNAVDHGLETQEERVAAGKPAAGTVRLRAYKASGNVVVELSDDGKGLSPEALARRAIERGLIPPAHGLSQGQLFNLIFAPGFSTAEKVTDVSGRGVGMDVVRRSIESLNGRVETTSDLGQGTTFCIRLPLTLAITDGMLLRVGQERYIIPTSSIGMSLRPERSQLKTVSGKGELLLLRGQPIPLFRMDRVLGIPGGLKDPCEGLLVLVNDGVQTVAFLVDALLGKQQVVTKSLGEGIGKVPGILGGAILSDGRVGLILDPPGLVALAQQAGAGVGYAA